MGRASGTDKKQQQLAGEEMQAFVRSLAASLTDPLGIPSAVVGTVAPGARDKWREVQQETVPGQVFGSLASPVGTAGAALKAGVTGAPKVAGAMIGGLGLMGSPSETTADDEDPIAKAIQGNPALEGKYTLMRQKEAEAKASIKGVKPDSADKIRKEAAAEASKLRTELFKDIERLNPPKQSFEDANPGLAANWPLVQTGAGLAAGAVTKGLANTVVSAANRPWSTAVRQAQKAENPGSVARFFGAETDPVKFHQAATKAGSYLKEYDKGSKWGRAAAKVGEEAVSAGSGALVGVEAELYRVRYDLENAPKDSPEYAVAEQKMKDAVKTYGMAAVMGALGGATGAHTFGSMVPRVEAPVRQTRALMRRYDDDYTSNAEKLAKSFQADDMLASRGATSSAAAPPAVPQAPNASAATANPPPQRAPSPADGLGPQGPMAVPYDQQLHGPIARQYLDELLSHRNPTRQSMMMQTDKDGTMARDIQKRITDAGGMPVYPADLRSRVDATSDKAAEIDRLAKAVNPNASITNPRLRSENLNVLDLIQGNPGQLAIAGAGGGLALSELPPEVLDALIQQLLAQEGGS